MKTTTAVGLVLLFSFLIAAVSLGFVFYAWRSTLNGAEHTVEGLSFDARLAALHAIGDNARALLHRFNTSAISLARVLRGGSSLPFPTSSFSSLKMQVARSLFLAYMAQRPVVSQVTFLREDGLLLSYYDDGNGTTHVIFSNNNTAPSLNTSAASDCYYSQAVDEDTGDPVDDAAASPIPCNSDTTSHLGGAFANGAGYVPLVPGWGRDKEPVLLFTAPVKVAPFDRASPPAALSLGVPARVLADTIQGGAGHGVGLFLATADGRVLLDGGPPGARILLNNGTVSVHVQNHETGPDVSNEEEEYGLPCMAGGDSDSSEGTLLDVGGQAFKFYCTSLDTAGINLVYVLAFSHMHLTNHVNRFYTMASFLLLLVPSMMMIACVLMFHWLRKYQRGETFLYSSLIKQKEATQQAERKSMNKSLAFASASHDVRTCLAGIIGLIELCQSEVSPQSELEKNLNQMKNCASKLLGILNSVLDISKVEAGKMQLKDVEFNVAEVIEESIDIFHIVARKKGLEVIWDPCDSSVLNSLNVKGDPGRLKQILDNLLSNAIKFTLEGHVLIRAWAKKAVVEAVTCSHSYACNFSHMPSLFSCFSSRNDEAFGDSSTLYPTNHDPNSIEFIFEVDDTGIGIPKDRRESIFENYVQVKESINEQEGTGLGLGIVQSYVRLMGGEINIIDKGPNEKGACFRFNIFLKSFEMIDERADIVSKEGEASNELPNSSVSITNPQCGYHNANQSKSREMTFCKVLKDDAIHVLLLIHGKETRMIFKRWFESLGVKVWLVDQWELLAPTLDKIRQKLSSCQHNIFETSDMLTIQMDKGIEIEESSSIKDEPDCVLPPNMPIHELHRKTSFTSTSVYTLILIDMSFGSLHDAHFALNNFMKNTTHNQCKVVWLANSDTPTVELRTLKNKEVPCDLILHKPLHGSRLHAIMKLLQEFGEPMEVIIDTKIDNMLQEEDKLNANYNSDRPLHGMKVLVVEDNVVLRHLTSSTLSHLGASVELSENGRDALHLVRKALYEKTILVDESMEKQNLSGITSHLPYDIILMDCEMPIMNGYDATKQIRVEEKQYGIHIPIIALTAHSMAEQEIDFTQAGMDIHLMKPLRPDTLLDAIHKIRKN